MIPCSAPILDRREVASSNGEKEMRYVIESRMSVGGQEWPIEITLTNRSTMTSRMLLGRQALKDHITIVATDRFLQPELSYDVYHSSRMRQAQPERALRIAVLSREDNYSTRRLVEEGEKRGHTVEVIDTTRCYMAINAMAPEVHYDGKRLPRFDAVIPRIGASITPYGAAVIRQFETIGTYCVNPSAGISASRDKLYAHQLMARAQIGMPNTAFAASPKDTGNLIGLVGTAPLIVKLLESTQGKGVVLAETKKAAESVIDAFRGLKANFLVQDFVKEAAGEDIRCLVVGGKVVASMKRTGADGRFPLQPASRRQRQIGAHHPRRARHGGARRPRLRAESRRGRPAALGVGAQGARGQLLARLRGDREIHRQERRRKALRPDRDPRAPGPGPAAKDGPARPPTLPRDDRSENLNSFGAA